MVINKVSVTKKFRFEACHHLPNYKGKCANMHGHSYFGEVTISGPINKETGMVMDFHSLGCYIDEMIFDLDHQNLNEVTKEGFPNEMPTAENMATWMLEYLQKRIHVNNKNLTVECVSLNETEDNYACAYCIDEGINIPEGHYYYSEVPMPENDNSKEASTNNCKTECFTFNKDNFEKSLKEVKNKLEKNINEFVENIKNIEINISKKK